MTQYDWAAGLAQTIAGEIRRHREAQNMSAQQLADRCAELGMKIARSVIANLENGRRPTVSVAELLILAAALAVPPAVLIAPLGQAPEANILPDRELTTLDAILWIAGETRLPEDASEKETDWIQETDPDALIPLYREHDGLLDQLKATDRLFQGELTLTDTSGNAIEAEKYRDRSLRELRNLRALMRHRGLLLPALPPELADIDTAKRTTSRRSRQYPGGE